MGSGFCMKWTSVRSVYVCCLLIVIRAGRNLIKCGLMYNCKSQVYFEMFDRKWGLVLAECIESTVFLSCADFVVTFQLCFPPVCNSSLRMGMNEEKYMLLLTLSGYYSEKCVVGRQKIIYFHEEMKVLETANKWHNKVQGNSFGFKYSVPSPYLLSLTLYFETLW